MKSMLEKIDLFMKIHVIPFFNPDQIHWVFSISGGKDSFVLCNSVREWYEATSHLFCASGIHIWQWGDENPKQILDQSLPWLNIEVIDARVDTRVMVMNQKSTQAPCRLCSDIRHDFSDVYLDQLKTDRPIFLCRGLHMTDIAISVLWRLVWYGLDKTLDGKGKPIVHLMKNAYLAKPMCFVREFESQMYAIQNNYTVMHCDCPAHLFPSRRDIVEESVRQFYTSPLWEFDIPGIDKYFTETAGLADIDYLKSVSLCGVETKDNTIPDSYYEFAKNHFLGVKIPNWCSTSLPLLEQYVGDFLQKGKYSACAELRYGCKLISNPELLSNFDLRMIGTLGPFWAAFTLPMHHRMHIYNLQREIWGFSPDIKWGQVHSLMELYYNSKHFK